MVSWFIALVFAFVVVVAYRRRMRAKKAERAMTEERLLVLFRELNRLSIRVHAVYEELQALPVPLPLTSRRFQYASRLRPQIGQARAAAYRIVKNRQRSLHQLALEAEQVIVQLGGLEEAVYAAERELNGDIHRWAEQEYHGLMPYIRETQDELTREMSRGLHRNYEVLIGTPDPVRHPKITEAFVGSHSIVLALAHLQARERIKNDWTVN